MLTLHRFHGGLHLDAHKEDSSLAPLATAPVPPRLIFPLQQRGGQNAQSVVRIGDHVRKGQVIARGDGPMNPPIHASSSGIVSAIEPHPLPHPSGLADLAIVIDTDGEDLALEAEAHPDYHRLAPDELRRIIFEAGIVGLGGAAFPTAVKTDPGHRAIDTLILNGAECEPYITCDDSLLRHFPREVLEGARILMQVLGVERCLLGIEDDMPEAIRALREIRQTGDYSSIDIVVVPALYPSGGEKQLIHLLTGREVPARGIPADAGVVCQNVGTAAAVFRAVVRGEPLIERIVTVTGKGIRNPGNWLARIGTPIADLVRYSGGYSGAAERLILGGPMMGISLPSDALPLVKAANCVLVTGRGETTGPKQALPCIRCGACAEVCPINLLPQQLYWYSRADNLRRAEEYQLADCIECGCCDYVCPSHIPLVQYFRAAKSELVAKQRERAKADRARERFEARQARKEREKQERAEAAQRKKAALAKPDASEIQDAIARAKARKRPPGSTPVADVAASESTPPQEPLHN
ncbi:MULTISPECIES: electron transport complex subunit RsxC [Methylococcus]|uniref:Ion-translocating oxidoreductase complex subunit C n=1 Tax=Methylococcus capsulatus TaxID=414 RepID=A0ABZ2F6H7_METCP|nr:MULTISPECIES: electron transport complex subunit RsxC [Methylococcus]MDF9393656.1 electron transport complex subunit RsxC [Methylococcus capsulatus]